MRKKYPHVPTFFIICLCVFLTGIASYYVYRTEITSRKKYFESAVQERIVALKNEITLNLGSLYALRGLYNASDSVSRDEFRKFSLDLLKQRKNIIFLHWTKRVKGSEREEFIENIRREDVSDFVIKKFDNKGLVQSSEGLSVYYPLLYVEPLFENTDLVGFDAFGNLDLKLTLEAAIENDKLVISNIKEGSHLGYPYQEIIAYLPVYSNDESLEDNGLLNVNGFVGAELNITSLIKEVFGHFKPFGLNVYFYDDFSKNKEPFLYFTDEDGDDEQLNVVNQADFKLKYTQTVSVAQQQWNVLFLPSKAFLNKSKFYFSFAIFFFGLIIAAGLFHFINSVIRRQDIVEDMVQVRTKELDESGQKLKVAQEQLVQSQKMAAVGQLAAGIAHEINNPVGFISGNLDAMYQYVKNLCAIISLKDGMVEAVEADDLVRAKSIGAEIKVLEQEFDVSFIRSDIEKLLEESQLGLNRIQKIVGDLKNHAHIDMKKMIMSNVKRLVERALQMVSSELKYKVNLDVDYGNTPDIMCDRQKIEQVLINLLINATHAIEKKGVIKIRTDMKEKHVRIHIQDNGSGMTKACQEKIFNPFFTTKSVGKGTGLGLGICYEIVKQHMGFIEVQSEVGKGSTFTVTLPIMQNVEQYQKA